MGVAMKIDKSKIVYLWYENEQGDKWVPPKGYCGSPKPPAGFIYQRSQFPFSVHEVMLRCYEDKSVEVCSGNSSWPENLVLAMTNSGDYGLYQAIFVAANACSRCLNALSFTYLGSEEGFSEDSEEYKYSNTRCEWCDEG
jgi:hypothetical protein